MTALALGIAALVGIGATLLAGWLGDRPTERTVTRVEQVGDQIAVVNIAEDTEGAEAAATARRQGLQWMLIALGASFLPAAGLAWLVAGRLLRPVSRVADVVDRVDAPDAPERVALAARDDELGQLAESLDRMLDRLEAHQAEQQRQLQEVLHELRTPLAVAGTNLDLAADDPAAEEAAAQLAAVGRALARMRRTVDDLAAHGRLAVGEEAALVDLAAEARALGAEHAGLAAGREIRITAAGEDRVPAAADREALRTAVGNLLANAVRLAPAGSTIALGWGWSDGWAWIAVRDEGPGIATTDHPRVFERYWRGRADADRDPEAGVRGLGLTIARQVTEAQGGHLTVTSAEGAGSTFTVWLPASPDARASDVVAPDGVHPVADPFPAVAWA